MSASSSSTRLSDLVRDSQLTAAFSSGLTLHSYHVSSRSARQRKQVVEEAWEVQRELGNGTFGLVRLERCVKGPRAAQLRAVKEIIKAPTQGAAVIDYYRELEAMAKFSNEKYVHCFVKLFGWYERDNTLFIAMEYLEHGDLEKHLQSPVAEIEAREIASQLVEGLHYMHDNGFSHRDLKPANILVLQPRPDWWVKISDFGISKRAEEGTMLRTLIGTRGYLAPELMSIFPLSEIPSPDEAKERSYTSAVDIWALGEICFRMLARRPAFPDTRDMFNYVVHDRPFPQKLLVDKYKLGPDCCDFVGKAMTASATRRPKATELMAHPWLQAAAPLPDGSSATEVGISAESSDERTEADSIDLSTQEDYDGSARWTTLEPGRLTDRVGVSPGASALGSSSSPDARALQPGPVDLVLPVRGNASPVDLAPPSTYFPTSSARLTTMDPASADFPNFQDSLLNSPGLIQSPNRASQTKWKPPGNDLPASPAKSSHGSGVANAAENSDETGDLEMRVGAIQSYISTLSKNGKGQKLPGHLTSQTWKSPLSDPDLRRINSLLSSAIPKSLFHAGIDDDTLPLFSNECLTLVRLCTEGIISRGLDLPSILMPFRSGYDPNGIRSLLKEYFSSASSWRLDSRIAGANPRILAGILRWYWSKLPNGVIGEAIFQYIQKLAQDATAPSYVVKRPTQEMLQSIAGNDNHARIIWHFLRLLFSVIESGKDVPSSVHVLIPVASWWAFKISVFTGTFVSTYTAWRSNISSMVQLFKWYIRTEAEVPMNWVVKESLLFELENLPEHAEHPLMHYTVYYHGSIPQTPPLLLQESLHKFKSRRPPEIYELSGSTGERLDGLHPECREPFRLMSRQDALAIHEHAETLSSFPKYLENSIRMSKNTTVMAFDPRFWWVWMLNQADEADPWSKVLFGPSVLFQTTGLRWIVFEPHLRLPEGEATAGSRDAPMPPARRQLGPSAGRLDGAELPSAGGSQVSVQPPRREPVRVDGYRGPRAGAQGPRREPRHVEAHQPLAFEAFVADGWRANAQPLQREPGRVDGDRPPILPATHASGSHVNAQPPGRPSGGAEYAPPPGIVSPAELTTSVLDSPLERSLLVYVRDDDTPQQRRPGAARRVMDYFRQKPNQTYKE